MDTFLCIRSFAAVVEAGSFARAAHRLRLSPATVTKHVQNLEQRVGTRLLNRTTRYVNPTEAGTRYWRYCRAMLAELEEVEAEIGERAMLPRGRISVTAAYDFGVAELEPVVLAFVTAYPEITVELRLTQRFVDLAAENVDVAVRCVPQPSETSLIVRRLAASRLVLCAAPGYLQARGTPSEPVELRRHDCLIYTGTSWTNSWPLARDGISQRVRVNGRIWTNDNSLLRRAALAGLGIAVQPSFNVWKDLREGALARVLADWRIGELGVYAVFRERRLLPARIRVFVDFLAAHFRARSGWERFDEAAYGEPCAGFAEAGEAGRSPEPAAEQPGEAPARRGH